MRRNLSKGKLNHERWVFYLLGISLVIGVVAFGYALYNLFSPVADDSSGEGHTVFRLTTFDRDLAHRLMDKDSDGKCDACGMDVEMCIDTGQLECTMTGFQGIGILDPTKKKHHTHADFKVILNGKAVDFAQPRYAVKSAFLHVEQDQKPGSGEVLHMHAQNVPLWVFFESVGMSLDKECFALDSGERFCTSNEKTLSFFVNGKPHDAYGNYVFRDGDQLLISYGSEGDISSQLLQLHDYSKLYRAGS